VTDAGVGRLSTLKPVRHPRFWLGAWWLAIAVVTIVCLLPASDLPKVPLLNDKLEHALAYFLLAASAVQLFATRRTLWRVATGLLLLGIAIEIAQGLFTSSRAMEGADVLADLSGIIIGMATLWTPLRDLLLRIDGRRD